MVGLVLGGGLVRMIPVRKDWYLGGGGSFSFCSLLNYFVFNNFFWGGGLSRGVSIAVFVACQHLLSYITSFKYCSLNDFVL